ncbi:MAG TPA: hypothetical protein VNJ01_03880 [Bacteriovoracaceae bacterium]|nr:hypothetical protein [Bacteriovoracaceae bacterium]
MEYVESNPFIFYLSLEETLPKDFYVFDRCFKDLGFLLVPVKIDQLQMLLTSTDQAHFIFISSVTQARELKLFNEKVRGLLKYVLKTKSLTYFQFSSFSKINDTRIHNLSKNYYFLKYPIDAAVLTRRIACYFEDKSEVSVKWPGGKKAGVRTMSV